MCMCMCIHASSSCLVMPTASSDALCVPWPGALVASTLVRKESVVEHLVRGRVRGKGEDEA